MGKRIFDKPYFLFFILILLILICGFVPASKDFIFNIQATYFIIKNVDLAVILSIFYGFEALVYFCLIKLNFRLIKWMTVTHTLITIGGFIMICLLPQLIRESKPGDFQSLITDMDFNEKIISSIWLFVFSIIAVQILFLINCIYALIKART